MSREPFVGYVLLILSVLFSSATAAELNFSAGVDRATVGLGEQLTLTVTVEGSNMGNVPRPQLPQLDGFTQVGSTSSQSTNIAFVNGRMSQQQTVSFIYFLEPKRLGNLTIGPAKLDFKGMVYQTQPISIAVTQESQAPPPRQQQQPPSPFGFPSQPQPRGATRGAVHLTASADRTSVYQGEQLTVTYTFYARAQVANLNMKDAPSLSGFWSEKIFDARDLNWRNSTYDGQRYNAATLKQTALFPTQSGELTLDKMTVSGEMIVSGGFFFDASEPFEVSSEPIRINVKPLPDAGRPAGFSGGVGDFKLRAALSKDSSTGGEPLTLSVKVSGTGNIGIIGEPQVAQVTGIKLLAPETKQEISSSGGRISGTRTFSYPVIPQADGRHVIPEIAASFFNPKSGSYYTLKTQPLSFVATGATGRVPLSEAEAGVQVLGSDIVHIKPARGRLADMAIAGWWTWLFYPAGILVLAAGLIMGRHQRRLAGDRGYARLSRSSRLVRKRLAEATKFLTGGNEREFYAALSRAVIGYVGDRFNLEAFGMTGDQMHAELVQRGVEMDTVSALLGLIANCDAARFSPGMAQCSPQETLDRARAILEKL